MRREGRNEKTKRVKKGGEEKDKIRDERKGSYRV